MAAVLVWIMIPFFAAAHAAVFKCSADGGRVLYQDVECQPGTELRNFDTDPPNVSIVPGTPESRPAPPPKAAPATRAAAERRVAKGKTTDTKAAGRRFAQIGMSEAEVVERFGRPEVDSRRRPGHGE